MRSADLRRRRLVRVQLGEPAPKARRINSLQIRPNRSIELPQRNSLICMASEIHTP